MFYTPEHKPNYLLLDAARMLSEMDTAQEMNPQFVSLYKGTEDELLNSVAPHLFQYGNNELFEKWIEENTGKSWGIYIKSKANPEDMAFHFKQFLKVIDADKKRMFFRFYDPRVLNRILPSYDKKQVSKFFGPVQEFICEQDEGEYYTIYSHKNGELIQEKLQKKKFQAENKEEPTLISQDNKIVNAPSISKGRKWI